MRKAIIILTTVAVTLLISGVAMAQEGAVAATGDNFGSLAKAISALAIGLAAFGGALGQGKTMVAALEGIARNPAAQPKIFIPMIIGLALIESLVLYALVYGFAKF